MVWLSRCLCLAWLLCAVSGATAAESSFGDRLALIERGINSDARSAEQQAREILSGAQAAGDARAVAEANRVLGVALNILGDNAGAGAALERAWQGFEALAEPSRLALVRRHQGVMHYDLGHVDLALEHYLESLHRFEALGDAVEAAKTQANIGNVYWRSGEYGRAIEYQRAALATFESVQVPAAIAGTALNLGAALSAEAARDDLEPEHREGLLAESATMHRKALDIFTALEVPRGVLKAEANLAQVKARQGDIAAAIEILLRVRTLAAEVGDSIEEGLALKRLADLSFRLGRVSEARAHALEGLELARQTDNLPDQEELLQRLSESSERLGDPAAALTYAREAAALGRQIAAADREVRLAELTRELEDHQRDQELQALRQAQALDHLEIERQRVMRNAAVIIGVLALGWMVLLWSKGRLRERSRRELELAVATDPLTGLHNRRGLRAWVGQTEVVRGDYAVVLCDVDNFKRINDEHGHDVGDAVISETARRLRQTLRPEDEAARWGGEEFLLVLAVTDSAQALAAAERLRLAVAEKPVAAVAGGLQVTVSVGVAIGSHGQGFDISVRAADQALLQAKREGKNRVLLAPVKIRALGPVARAG
jgi:diguanylate cyclase (GGDEF)-like protein